MKKKKSAAKKSGKSKTFYLPAIASPELVKKSRSLALQRLKRATSSYHNVKNQHEDYLTRHKPAYERWFSENFSKERQEFEELRRQFVEKQRELSEELFAELMEELGFDERAEESVKGEGDVDFEFSDGPQPDLDEECDCAACRGRKNNFSAMDSEDQADYLAGEFERFSGRSPFLNRETRRAFEKFKAEAYRRLGTKNSDTNKRDANALQDERLQVKQFYRLLVRLLHPDARANAGAYDRDLWEQVQFAYEKKDLVALKQLLALARTDEKKHLSEMPIADISAAAELLKVRTKHLRRSVTAFKRDPSWGFANLSAGDLKKEYRLCMAEFKDACSDLRRQIRGLSRPQKITKAGWYPNDMFE